METLYKERYLEKPFDVRVCGDYLAEPQIEFVNLYAKEHPEIAVNVRYMFEHFDKGDATYQYGIGPLHKRMLEGDERACLVVSIWTSYMRNRQPEKRI